MTWCVQGLEPGNTFFLKKLNIGPVRDVIVPGSIVIKSDNQGEAFIPISTKRKGRQILKPGTTMFKGFDLEEKDLEVEPEQTVGKVIITNEMLPHFDSAQEDNRLERLNTLLDEI